MIFIISHHFRGHGGWAFVVGGANTFFMDLTSSLFMPSVNVFVMISAYFLCTKDNLKISWKKLGKLWLTVFFYSIVLFAVFTAIGIYQFDVRALLSSLFPIAFSKYWFVSAYFLMMIASPFLNAIVSRLNKAQFSAFAVFIIILAALQDVGVFLTIPLANGYNGIWFCLLYLLTAYFRKFDINLNKIGWIVCAIVFVAVVIFNTLVWKGPHYTSITTIYMSLFILLTAKKFAIKNVKLGKIICFISSLTFGVYLIHDSNEMRGFMYENIFHSSKFIPSKYAFLIYIGFVLLTFVVCALIEFVRQLCFNGCAKLISTLFGEKLIALQTRINSFIEKIAAHFV